MDKQLKEQLKIILDEIKGDRELSSRGDMLLEDAHKLLDQHEPSPLCEIVQLCEEYSKAIKGSLIEWGITDSLVNEGVDVKVTVFNHFGTQYRAADKDHCQIVKDLRTALANGGFDK